MSPKFELRPRRALALAGACAAAATSLSAEADATTVPFTDAGAGQAISAVTDVPHQLASRLLHVQHQPQINAGALRASMRRIEHAQLRTAAIRAAADQAHSQVAEMISAGNQIATLPYVYGGGHGSFQAAGYDCSGSVSYVLHAAGLLSEPLTSSGLEGYGAPGPGRHVTIYANAEHAFMTIDGRRFDTIALQETGNRWSDEIGDTSGYVAVHPPGL